MTLPARRHSRQGPPGDAGGGRAATLDPPDGTAPPSPSDCLPPLGSDDLRTLEEVGKAWSAAFGWSGIGDLPVDLAEAVADQATGRDGVHDGNPFHEAGKNEVVAVREAAAPPSRPARSMDHLLRLVVGPRLASTALAQERMRKLLALPLLSSDLLSSVAYGPEAMLSVLVLAGAGALSLSLPLAAGLVALIVAVGLSYRQIIRAYPSGAGSYQVAGDNLGRIPSLAAAAGLVTDYVLTVSVSVASGVAAVTSALPWLRPATTLLGVAIVALLVVANLRGVRQAGRLFAAPTYLFLLALWMVVIVGLARSGLDGWHASPPPHVEALQVLGPVLVLRAFASGASSMTGIEAISNAIPAFQPVQWRNARATLDWMLGLLVCLLLGLVVLVHLDGIAPQATQTVLSQLAHRVLGAGTLYAFVQASTALVLLMAANTSFNGFPRILFFMARDDHAPRAFLRLGDRLAFSNGIILLGGLSTGVLIAFGGRTEALIPLYAVGVFLAFTLSQAGMVRHWWRHRQRGWRGSMAVNGFGAVLSALVLVIAAATKFLEGAWVVVIGIPLLVVLLAAIHRHYRRARTATALHPLFDAHMPPGGGAELSRRGRAEDEAQEVPSDVHHMVIVLLATLDLAALRALAYAASLALPVLAVHVSPGDEEARRFQEEWRAWGDHLPLETIISPYRATLGPLVRYVETLRAASPELTLTVVVPEVVVRHWWQRPLHSPLGPELRHAFRREPGIVVSSVPFHLPR